MARQPQKSSGRTSSIKQQRRAQAERKARQTRMYAALAGIVLLAVIAVIVLINANKPVEPVGEFVTVPTQTWPEANGVAIGPADASVVLLEFADFQCPVCKTYNETIQPKIIEDYVKTGKIRYEFHHFIVIDGNVGGTESRHAAEASMCASDQGRFWDYHEILFANQAGEGSGALADQRLKAFAESIGLDTQKFNSCFSAKRFTNAITADDAQARSLGLNGTPSLVLNGQKLENPLNYTAVKAAIDAALAGTQ